MKYPLKLIVCVLLAWIPSYLVCDYLSTVAVQSFMPANPLFDQKGAMWVERGALAMAREGELPNVSTAAAYALIFEWAGKWAFTYPTDVLIGFITFWWRWVALGLAFVTGSQWASGESGGASRRRDDEPTPAAPVAPGI